MSGRFAPSPTGDLHIGNLRTAVMSWLDARSHGIDWLVRFEDLDGVVANSDAGERQLDSLAALGLVPDHAPIWQSDHVERYDSAIERLVVAGRTFRCFCSRREIREAIEESASAPNGAGPAAYPGTCARLGQVEADQRASTHPRPAALRFRSESVTVGFDDEVAGPQSFVVDDFVIRRNDGVAAYNLVVVVDDDFQGVTRVVRADDLLASTARQMLVAEALGFAPFRYAHVPLVVNADGERLSKRDGSITMPQLAELGWRSGDVLAWIATSMRLSDGASADIEAMQKRWLNRPPVSQWTNLWQV